MHNIQIDRILTEAMGRCWHEFEDLRDKELALKCKKCEYKYIIEAGKTKTLNPHPTTNWQDYGEVIEWAKGQKWWSGTTGFKIKYMLENLDNKETDSIIDVLTHPETGSRALAEFIESEGV